VYQANDRQHAVGSIVSQEELPTMTTWLFLAAAAVGATAIWYSWKRRRGR